jgi:hypothetical protein
LALGFTWASFGRFKSCLTQFPLFPCVLALPLCPLCEPRSAAVPAYALVSTRFIPRKRSSLM